MKVSIAITGFAPRSFKYTAKSLEKCIIEPIRNSGHEVSITMYSFLSRSKKIDTDARGDLQDYSEDIDFLIPEARVTCAYQEDYDSFLRTHPVVTGNMYHFYPKSCRLNVARAMYQELRAVKLADDDTDVCVLVRNDFFILNKLDCKILEDVRSDPSVFYYLNGWGGFGGIENGMYVTTRKNAIAVSSLFENTYINCELYYEQALEQHLKSLGLTLKPLTISYEGIRSGGIPRFLSSCEKYGRSTKCEHLCSNNCLDNDKVESYLSSL